MRSLAAGEKMPAPNANDGSSRLDRVERILEALAEGHLELQQEHKLLLTAQILVTDNMAKLELKQSETTDKLNALINLMDRHLREHGPSSGH
jgi:hypothetical protein